MKQIFKKAAFFIIGIISFILLAYISSIYHIKLAIIILLMNLLIISILLYELLRQKQYSFIKRVAIEIPFVFTFGVALDYLESWYSNASPTINIQGGLMITGAYLLARLGLQITKIKKS